MSEFGKKIEILLENKTGLSVSTLGYSAVRRALSRRMTALGISNENDYLVYLEGSEPEMGELTELVIVPETRFFRNPESYEFLREYLISDWLSRKVSQTIRILSIPCSSGEEAYSIVVTLADAGIPYHKFYLDAADISQRLLDKAVTGIYGRESFKNGKPGFDQKYYHVVSGGYRMADSVRQKVRWIKGNLSDSGFLKHELPYHIVFCRNLMIYLSDSARRRGIENITRLLAPQGLLFVGHAEHGLFSLPTLCRLHPLQAFVFREGVTPVRENISQPTEFTTSQIVCNEDSISRKPDIPSDCPIGEPKPAEALAPTSIAEIKSYADQGNLQQAAELCKIYLAANPTDAEVHFLMGLVMKARKDDSGAEHWLNKALYLDPRHEDALHYLAVILEKRGEISAANQLKQRCERVVKVRKEK
jgi:chemotaxis protein methyltransferase WspC